MSTRPHDLAFPLIDTTGTGGPYLNLGLTKREYFAAMAMKPIDHAPRCDTCGAEITTGMMRIRVSWSGAHGS